MQVKMEIWIYLCTVLFFLVPPTSSGSSRSRISRCESVDREKDRSKHWDNSRSDSRGMRRERSSLEEHHYKDSSSGAEKLYDGDGRRKRSRHEGPRRTPGTSSFIIAWAEEMPLMVPLKIKIKRLPRLYLAVDYYSDHAWYDQEEGSTISRGGIVHQYSSVMRHLSRRKWWSWPKSWYVLRGKKSQYHAFGISSDFYI